MTSLPRLTLVLGGARSGKSRYAEQMLAGHTAPLYIATATAGDAEMQARIDRHRRQRGAAWQTREEPLALPAALTEASSPERPVLVDCLTLWLTNLMEAGRDIEQEFCVLLTALSGLPGSVVLVGNEVGLGIVPENGMAREFRDHAGRLHQQIAARADRVVLMVAGLPLLVKGG
jgi:adenosylcobinamide kinase/adenosylcobinamide-phosphate guanylyltransferase